MEYKEPKKRVTKADKKNKKGVYTSKHVRNVLRMLNRGTKYYCWSIVCVFNPM